MKDLRAVPADRIRDWWVAQFAQPRHQRVVDSGRQYRGPVRDPVLLPAFDVHQPLPDIPAISVYTSTEGSFFTGPNAPEPQAPPTDDASCTPPSVTFWTRGCRRYQIPWSPMPLPCTRIRRTGG